MYKILTEKDAHELKQSAYEIIDAITVMQQQQKTPPTEKQLEMVMVLKSSLSLSQAAAESVIN